MSVKDYLSVISGSLAVLIALVIILISFKAKYKSRILSLRLTALILIILGVLSLFELLD